MENGQLIMDNEQRDFLNFQIISFLTNRLAPIIAMTFNVIAISSTDVILIVKEKFS